MTLAQRRTDPDGRFWNYLAGAVAGATVEYAGQVAANIVKSGRISTDSFTKVDLIDIAVAAGEGALTSGGSAIKSAGKRFAVTAVAELTKNTFDKNTGENVKVNDGVTVVKNTAIGLIGGEITTKAKLNVLPTQSKTKAVDASRTAAHSKGRGLSTSQAKQTAKNQEMKNTRAKNVNATLTNNLNGATGGIGSEIAKKSTDNEKKR